LLAGFEIFEQGERAAAFQGVPIKRLIIIQSFATARQRRLYQDESRRCKQKKN
jgi:hypothetical protein